MKKIVWRFFWDYEKEENWLNEMAALGYHFIDYSFPGRYLFEKGNPGEYVYRIELLKESSNHPESEAYIHFMEENEIECVSTYIRWVYFRTKHKDALVHLYTDNESKLRHYNGIYKFVLTVWVANLLAAISNYIIWYLIALEKGVYLNLFFAILSSVIVILMAPMLYRSYRKVKDIKKQKELFE